MAFLLTAIPAVVAVGGWLLAFGSSIELALRHRLEDHSVSWYALNGYAFFDASSFAPSGADAHRRMMIGMGVFLLGALLSGLGAVISSAL